MEICDKGEQNQKSLRSTGMYHDVPFMIKSDVSDYVIAANLSQCKRPVAYMSRHSTEYPAIKKEVTV